MATRNGLEPSTSSVTGWRSNQLNYRATLRKDGGNNRARTCDPLLVRQVLSQLSYAPEGVVFLATSYMILYPFRNVNTKFEVFLIFFNHFLQIAFREAINGITELASCLHNAVFVGKFEQFFGFQGDQRALHTFL